MLTHGLNEHSGRYAELAKWLVARGFAVWAYDQPGHGRSDGLRSYIEEFEVVREPHRQFYQLVVEHSQRVPVLMGHSLGGLVLVDGLLAHGMTIEGIVLSSPALAKPASVGSLTISIGRLLSWLIPRFPIIPVRAEELTHDVEQQRAFNNDLLINHSKVGARTAAVCLRGMQECQQRASELFSPFYIMQAGDDSIVDSRGVQDFYSNLGASGKELKIYDGLYHEVLNEAKRDVVWSDLGVWLDALLCEKSD